MVVFLLYQFCVGPVGVGLKYHMMQTYRTHFSITCIAAVVACTVAK